MRAGKGDYRFEPPNRFATRGFGLVDDGILSRFYNTSRRNISARRPDFGLCSLKAAILRTRLFTEYSIWRSSMSAEALSKKRRNIVVARHCTHHDADISLCVRCISYWYPEVANAEASKYARSRARQDRDPYYWLGVDRSTTEREYQKALSTLSSARHNPDHWTPGGAPLFGYQHIGGGMQPQAKNHSQYWHR